MNSFSLSLLQVLLPDNLSLLSVSIPTSISNPTIKDLIQEIFNDDSNHKTLQNVFGINFNVNHTSNGNGNQVGDGDEVEKWFRDSNGNTWAIQLVNLSELNREWKIGEMQPDRDGESSIKDRVDERKESTTERMIEIEIGKG